MIEGHLAIAGLLGLTVESLMHAVHHPRRIGDAHGLEACRPRTFHARRRILHHQGAPYAQPRGGQQIGIGRRFVPLDIVARDYRAQMGANARSFEQRLDLRARARRDYAEAVALSKLAEEIRHARSEWGVHSHALLE